MTAHGRTSRALTQRPKTGRELHGRRLAVVALLTALAVPLCAAAGAQPTLSVSPDPVNAGGTIVVVGSNHCQTIGNGWVTIDIANNPSKEERENDGRFRTIGRAPYAPGDHTVSSYCNGEPGENFFAAETQFTVKSATLSVQPTTIHRSETLTVTITDPPVCRTFSLFLLDPATQALTEVNATWTGDPDRLTTHAAIPNDMGPGEYTARAVAGVCALAGSGDLPPTLAAEFTVLAGDPFATPTPSLTPGQGTPPAGGAPLPPLSTPGRRGQPTAPSQTGVFPGATETAAPTPTGVPSQPRAALASWLRPPSDPGLQSLRRVVIAFGLAVLLVLLIGFPAQIFESTLEKNYERVVGPIRRARRRWRTPRLPRPIVFAGFVVLAAALYALTDPTFGRDRDQTVLDTVLDAVGFLVAIPLVTLAFEVPVELYSRRGRRQRATFQVLPLALIVAVACALLSFVGHFQPGYVYGLIAGYAALRTRRLSSAESGRAVLVGAATVFSIVLLCWVAWGPIDDALKSSGGIGAGHRILDSVLATTVVVGVQALAFQLLPMTFLDGKALATWSRRSWQIVYAIVLFSLIFVTFWPRTRNEGVDPQVISVVALFIGFGAFSLAFWAYFRYAPDPRAATLGTHPVWIGRASVRPPSGAAPAEADRSNAFAGQSAKLSITRPGESARRPAGRIYLTTDRRRARDGEPSGPSH